MTPIKKFNSTIVVVTIAIMYFLCSYINNILQISEESTLVIAILGVFTSFGFYRFLSQVLNWLLQKFRFVKKIILGDRFLEGTWIGFYVGAGGEIRYFYETYEQTLDEVWISGYSFRADKTIHGKWKASNPIIDSENKKIIYYYETDMLGNLHINQGFASFTLEKRDKNKFFNKMIGFSSDIYNPTKLLAIEEKVSEDILADENNILQKADEIYNRNKYILPKTP